MWGTLLFLFFKGLKAVTLWVGGWEWMRYWIVMVTGSIAWLMGSGCTTPEKLGLAYSGETNVDHVQLLFDETWVDPAGTRHVRQEIFDSIFQMIDEADEFILVDFFLVNDFLYEPGPGLRRLSRELTDKLVEKRAANPDLDIVFISDPVNTVYGAIESPFFRELEDAGVRVVWTDLNKLRDSNPIYSKPWRLLGKPWGTGPGNAIGNPLGEGSISLRSMLKLMNFKANHRKVVVTEKSLLVTSANPHDASSAHWNVALRIDGAAMPLAWQAESAILRFSGAPDVQPPAFRVGTTTSSRSVSVLTERKIKDCVLTLLESAEPGTRIDLAMFYFSDRDLVRAFIAAHKRGCDIRVILDPNKDAFGKEKNGIPNRQTALRFATEGIPLRWADTHGEQCHVKMLYVEHADETSTFLIGSCNYTRRNTDNFNGECDLAYTAPINDSEMQRARSVFDRWWGNKEGRIYTTDYKTYEDRSVRRKIRGWLMEILGLSTF